MQIHCVAKGMRGKTEVENNNSQQDRQHQTAGAVAHRHQKTEHQLLHITTIAQTCFTVIT